ncbi:MAG: hypothetical protein ABL899_03190 [Nitrospira sp.]
MILNLLTIAMILDSKISLGSKEKLMRALLEVNEVLQEVKDLGQFPELVEKIRFGLSDEKFAEHLSVMLAELTSARASS